MARVPSLPYRIITTCIPVGQQQPRVENRNSPDLPGAWTIRDIELRKSHTRKVEVVMVIDESTPDHKHSTINGGHTLPVRHLNGR